LAELGCIEQEIMAITGHKTSKEIARYTKAARQKTRAESALAKISKSIRSSSSGVAAETSEPQHPKCWDFSLSKIGCVLCQCSTLANGLEK